MKVGTDGVLLGAWVRVDEAGRLLDIGCGTGLIALMCAQRNPELRIEAIDLDAESCTQACENVHRSPWSDRIAVHHTSLQRYTPEHRFSHIVSNPPYFINSLPAPDATRNRARHTTTLTQEALLEGSLRLLEPAGRLSVILPELEGMRFCDLALDAGLWLTRRTKVYPKPEAPLRRLMMEFQRPSGDLPLPTPDEESLTIETTSRHEYTAQYRHLTADFYLKF